MTREDIMGSPATTMARPVANERPRRAPLTAEEEWRYAEKALTWYGWGSPVGLSIFVVSLSVVAAVIRWIVAGF